MSPELSLVVPSRRPPAVLLELLLRLRHQTFGHNRFEVVVVIDDASPPGIASAVLNARVTVPYALRVVRTSGRDDGRARNAGVGRDGPPWIALLDDTCAPEPEWLAELVQGFGGGGEAVRGTVRLARRSSLVSRFVRSIQNRGPSTRRWSRFTVTNIALTRAGFAKAGGLSEGGRGPRELDLELFHRCAARQVRFRSAARAVVRRRGTVDFGGLFRAAFEMGRRDARWTRLTASGAGDSAPDGKASEARVRAIALERLPFALLAAAVAIAHALGRCVPVRTAVPTGIVEAPPRPSEPASVVGPSLRQGMDVVVLSNQCWREGPHQPVHQIMRRLRERHRIVFVEANYSFGKLVKALLGRPFRIAPFGRTRIVEPGRVMVVTPPPRLPMRHSVSWIGRLHQRILRAAVRRAARRFGVTRPILWSFVHQSADLVGAFDESLSIYHCVDPWSELIAEAGLGRRDRILEDERELARRVDLVFATARALRDDLLPHNPSCHYVPNAADVDAILAGVGRASGRPDPLAGLPRPRLGFLGSPTLKLDADLLVDLARLRPQWTFVIAGSLSKFPGRRRLAGVRNIVTLPPRPPAEVPALMGAFDVCLIPFRLDPLTRRISPLKLFEYLASGKPVVATPIPEVQGFEGIVRTARTAAGLEKEIREALEETGSELVRQRIERAWQNTWEHRVAELEQLIEAGLQNRSRRAGASEGAPEVLATHAMSSTDATRAATALLDQIRSLT